MDHRDPEGYLHRLRRPVADSDRDHVRQAIETAWRNWPDLDGEAIAGRDRRGQRITDPVLNTADDQQDPDSVPSGAPFGVGARSAVVFRRNGTAS